MILLTGDCHGDVVSHFSFRSHPEMRNLTSDDYAFILGDVGVPFGTQSPFYKKDFYRHDKYQLDWMNQQKYNFICIAGNHDDYDFLETLPKVASYKYHCALRQMAFDGKVYKNIFYIISPTYLKINNTRCLVIPGADSHDVADGTLDPIDVNFEKDYERLHKDINSCWRVKHWNYWPQEKPDIEAAKSVASIIGERGVDFILSHDCPATFAKEVGFTPTDSEIELEKLCNKFNYKKWYFGHMHKEKTSDIDERYTCLYNDFVTIQKKGN